MHTESLPPDAHLFNSMRAVGYSLPTAIADIVDNSVSARAARIDITFNGEVPVPFVSVLDNGQGMSAAAARDAMQLAGMSSTAFRRPGDLGRFGLGLKTASLSQCKCLTVVTKQGSDIVALRWDLDHIAKVRAWELIVLDDNEVAEVPGSEHLVALESGTLVVWQVLDRLYEQASHFPSFLDKQMIDVANHLELVFHRFLSGDGLRKTKIAINSVELEPADPFLSKSPRTQRSTVETINLEGADVVVQAYTLPIIAKMSSRELKLAQVPGSLRDSQGFYVYREGRLVIWGTWFRLMPRADMTKLTRVRVEIPNTLDHLWSLDIKKSSAVPPEIVRQRLRTLAGTLAKPSERAQVFRGRKFAIDEEIIRPWEVIQERDAVSYALNREHPVLKALSDGLDKAGFAQLEDALRMFEATLPLHDIYNRMSTDMKIENENEIAKMSTRWRDALHHLWSLSEEYEPPTEFVDRMLMVEPFTALRAERDKLVESFTSTKAGT
ncbi:Histidine kinase-, DNA gyrase B-, and HSP90-like ATPase [Agromyces cerinus subsp. cerinus]|uniref:Histidine kinase-, DNA gyrase B-, and HSP90-like ATPase n=1 Tax=Agromyces cerinus subsp. cerinus TaxID=232089 RepID=A0A1N6F225_9MICO|nr:Histidine kinase-, DNA gyrase B-, and HSP90-like ATPase [Agromyces cerinus subsp. cerinus]